MTHDRPHELHGQTVMLKNGKEYQIEDWADLVMGIPWMFANGNPAALKYAVRSAMEHLPIDNEVLYGKIGMFGELVHVSEIAETQKGEQRHDRTGEENPGTAEKDG